MVETAQRDYYDVLGLDRDANDKAIKDAFRKLAMQYHPDRNKSPEAESRFKEVAEAYAILSDPDKRAQYDARGHAGVAGFTAEDLFGGINFEDLFGGLGFDFGFGGSPFERFFRSRRGGSARGVDREIELRIPLHRIITGGEEVVRYPRVELCRACQGSRAKPGHPPRQCEDCSGSGKKVSSKVQSGVTLQQITTCPACHGQGVFIDKPCQECSGEGEIQHWETLKVNIPVGAEEGMALRIPGHGMPGHKQGTTAGDLYVIVRSEPDPHFQRRGIHLWRTETLTIPDAVLGTKLQVLTLEKSVTVRIPPGTQPGEVLRIKGKGLPEFGTNRRGDIYVAIEVNVPHALSRTQKKLYKQLRAEETH